MMNRREFLRDTPLLMGLVMGAIEGAAAAPAKVIILRSSWQTVNIGDIGHTPGVLTLLEKHMPQAEVRLWPSDVGDGVEEMLAKRFPKVKIIKTDEEKQKALKEGDFMLHGSGPSLVAKKDMDLWRKQTGKPYGIYGITFPGGYVFQEQAAKFDPLDMEIMNQARFCYFRDSVSYEFARSNGLTCKETGFSPDGAFAVDLRNDAPAIAFLKEHNLKDGEFVCVIPQYRFTPWWELKSKNRAVDKAKEAYNDKMKEQDNKPIREAIIAVVRQTNKKVLIVPENETQVRIGKEMLYDPLPDDVKEKVVWRSTYWLTDEAISTYVRSAGLFGIEMHSPIMCVANGIPAIVCRFKEQTSKGFMWKDVGLGEWLFDLDTPEDIARITPAVLDMIQNPAKSQAKVKKAMKLVDGIFKKTMGVLKKEVYV
ncbi:polysaccharide pyruvyl transferase family protein [Dyadobacter aurulentus]|uniref:polysaccharide pyruvyl transferase family protein n=1 Tax=Dyadobacter sp. UC 10 TaxID=2605428 RepID=UPI0011F33154|nr:polysaccharide pyruvyl transferase family protein [Dyadobacter sp. UC 10]KAA0992244.1 polysaccharide pyruvyl transferase family protein [Dyadobacter sp. UC 10]